MISYENKDSKKLVLPITEIGTYIISDNKNEILVTSGSLNSIEYRNLTATEKIGSPMIVESGGGIFWLVEDFPEFRYVSRGRDTKGKDWIGFFNNDASVVSGSKQIHIFNGLVFVIIALISLILVWRRESQA